MGVFKCPLLHTKASLQLTLCVKEVKTLSYCVFVRMCSSVCIDELFFIPSIGKTAFLIYCVNCVGC